MVVLNLLHWASSTDRFYSEFTASFHTFNTYLKALFTEKNSQCCFQMTRISLLALVNINCFLVGTTAMGVLPISLTPRAESAATAQMPTARSTSRQRAPTERISQSPPTCQLLAHSTHLCKVGFFKSSSEGEKMIFYFVQASVQKSHFSTTPLLLYS